MSFIEQRNDFLNEQNSNFNSQKFDFKKIKNEDKEILKNIYFKIIPKAKTSINLPEAHFTNKIDKSDSSKHQHFFKFLLNAYKNRKNLLLTSINFDYNENLKKFNPENRHKKIIDEIDLNILTDNEIYYFEFNFLEKELNLSTLNLYDYVNYYNYFKTIRFICTKKINEDKITYEIFLIDVFHLFATSNINKCKKEFKKHKDNDYCFSNIFSKIKN